MIAEEILLFGILGVLASTTIGFFVTDGKNIPMMLLLAFTGGFAGILSGAIWIYLTNGIQITLFALILPIFVSGFFTMLILMRSSAHIMSHRKVGSQISTLAVIGLFALAFIGAFYSVPIAYRDAANTNAYVSTLDWSSQETKVTDIAPLSTETIPITIETMQASGFSDMPGVNTYYDFKIGFRPDADWIQPYITIGVYKDADSDGTISESDVLWSDLKYKVGTEIGSKWRTNCLLENGKPKYNIHSSDGELLPIFHANIISKVYDETNSKLINTPEGFTAPNDMITWDGVTLKEYPIEYASIFAGETSYIQGRIYCDANSVGSNLIVVKTYCAKIANPYSETQSLQEKFIPFEVSVVQTQATVFGISLPMLLIGLGVMALVCLFYARKEGLL